MLFFGIFILCLCYVYIDNPNTLSDNTTDCLIDHVGKINYVVLQEML